MGQAGAPVNLTPRGGGVVSPRHTKPGCPPEFLAARSGSLFLAALQKIDFIIRLFRLRRAPGFSVNGIIGQLSFPGRLTIQFISMD